jgi:DNA modification methylase
MTTKIAIGDARTQLRLIPAESINCCVTSPPYWQKRDYQAGPDELGREPTIREYLDNLLQVIDEIDRVLMPHGSLWLNIGDTYATQAGTSRRIPYPETRSIHNVTNGDVLLKSAELPHKSLCLIPYRVAIAMQDRGWIVRNVIIWHKPDGMPENVQDRFTADYEPIFFCTKSPNYYFKQQVRPYSDKTLKRCQRYIENGEAFDPARHKVDPNRSSQAPFKLLGRIARSLAANGEDALSPAGANLRSVWRIPTVGYRGSHFAVFPEKFVEICVDAGCPVGGTVLDPFLGSGTTAIVAERMDRDFFGIELNPEYARHATERILKARATRLPAAPLKEPLEVHGVVAGNDENGRPFAEGMSEVAIPSRAPLGSTNGRTAPRHPTVILKEKNNEL